MLNNNLPHSVEKAIDSRTEAIIEDILHRIEYDSLDSIEACHVVVDETLVDDCAAIHIDLDDRLTLVECYGDEYDFEPITLDDLRTKLEGYAAALICYLAESRARELIEKLENFMDAEGFEFSEVGLSNNLEWARHYAEREDIEDCQVYEYRNVERDVHIDVYEYRLMDGTCLYFECSVDPSELSDDERAHEAH